MVSVDDLSAGRSLPAPMVVKVTDVNWTTRKSRRAEVALTDTGGNPLRLVDYEGADISVDWTVNHRYRISQCGVNRGGGGYDLELAPSKKTTVEELGRAQEATRLLVIGDSHVGYRHRPQSDKPTWAKDVNARDTFTRCLQRARDAKVDGVIHAGDIFDHHNTKGDRNRVGQEIARTVESDVAFYYVFGNHDDKQGRDLLQSTPGIHLAERTSYISKHLVKLQGVDHAGKSFPASAPTATVQVDKGPNILVIHETPYPVIDESGTLVYQNDVNKADISGYIETASYDIDLVITGHLHVANQLTLQDSDIPVIVTGSTIPISTYKKDSRPSTWLLTVTEDELELTRQPL